MIKIFVGGFPLATKEPELAQLFRPYGEVDSVKITNDRGTQNSKGYGFLEMKDQISATRAINALNGAYIEARRLTICLADKILTPSNEYSIK
jgi:RNA recognition motif-containing protein